MPPYDNTLVLGQLVDMDRIKRLEMLANIELPVKIADRKLNQLIMSERKLNGIHKQMQNFIPEDDTASLEKLAELSDKLMALKTKIGQAATQLIEKTMKSMKQRSAERKTQTQSKIGESLESPIDFTISAVAPHELAFDSMEFDVQYFRSEKNDQKVTTKLDKKDQYDSETVKGAQASKPKEDSDAENPDAEEADAEEERTPEDNERLKNLVAKQKVDSTYQDINSKVSSFVSNFLETASAQSFTDFVNGNSAGDMMATMDVSGQGLSAQTATVGAVQNIMENQTQMHDIEGTLVIVASCNHKMADVISPCVLDAVKLLNAWNETFPTDRLSTEPAAMFEVALTPRDRSKKDVNALHLLTGCTRASSFIGMCHVLKKISTTSNQTTDAKANQIKSVINQNAAVGYKTGQTREFMEKASNHVSTMLSSNSIYNHCSLVTQGIIPNIAASDVSQTVKQFSPTASGNLGALANITAANDNAFNTTASGMAEAASAIKTSTTGAKFTGEQTAFAESAVQAISDTEATKSKIIDTNSLMNAFTDYITKAQAGNCGVPVNFFIRKIDKAAVARAYICTFYPNGITTTMDAQKGAIGYKSADAVKV